MHNPHRYRNACMQIERMVRIVMQFRVMCSSVLRRFQRPSNFPMIYYQFVICG